jgi:hypothetical protein
MKVEFKTIKALLEEREDENLISYDELLLTTEWREFRKIILNRDSFSCKVCKKKANEPAWWLGPAVGLYVRHYSEEEAFYFGSDDEYSNEHVVLHVHHKYYVRRNWPWKYPEEALDTLCASCHADEHKKNEIFVYDDESLSSKTKAIACTKCQGTGYLPDYSYFKGGVCFKCHGIGYMSEFDTNVVK